MIFLQRGIPRLLFDLGGCSRMIQTGNTRQRSVNSYVVKPVDFEQVAEAVASPSHRRILGYARAELQGRIELCRRVCTQMDRACSYASRRPHSSRLRCRRYSHADNKK